MDEELFVAKSSNVMHEQEQIKDFHFHDFLSFVHSQKISQC